MRGNDTRFDQYLADEITKYKGIAVPVKASLLRRLLVRNLPCKKLHPNPYDDFCVAEIGPSYEIISGYEQAIVDSRLHSQLEAVEEPLTVEKIRPEGYMILNGHHRWAAAMRMGHRTVPVRIVNLTHEMDIRRMLENSKHNRRVTLDLNEVVFHPERDDLAEKRLPFPFSLLFKENLRLGVPGLFRFLNTQGYDIWVFTDRYYSMDYIRRLFEAHKVRVTGVVTGIGRKKQRQRRCQEKAGSAHESPVPAYRQY